MFQQWLSYTQQSRQRSLLTQRFHSIRPHSSPSQAKDVMTHFRAQPAYRGRGALLESHASHPSTAAASAAEAPSPPTQSPQSQSATATRPERILDPEAGRAATARVAAGGRLPKQYRAAGIRVTLIVITLPVVIFVTPYLWERIVMGKERKRVSHAAVTGQGDDNAVK